MKAIVYNGPRDVQVREIPDPTIQHPSNVIVKITTTNICGHAGAGYGYAKTTTVTCAS